MAGDDSLLEEILQVTGIDESALNTGITSQSASSEKMEVGISYTSSDSILYIRDVSVRLQKNGVFVETSSVAACLWHALLGSAEHADLDAEQLEFRGDIERYEGRREVHYFVPLSNGNQAGGLRLRVSSEGVTGVGDVSPGFVITGDDGDIQKMAESLVASLSPYVVGKKSDEGAVR